MGEESLAAVVRQIAPADSGADKVQWIEGLVKEALLAKTGASIPPGRAEGTAAPREAGRVLEKNAPREFNIFNSITFCGFVSTKDGRASARSKKATRPSDRHESDEPDPRAERATRNRASCTRKKPTSPAQRRGTGTA